MVLADNVVYRCLKSAEQCMIGSENTGLGSDVLFVCCAKCMVDGTPLCKCIICDS